MTTKNLWTEFNRVVIHEHRVPWRLTQFPSWLVQKIPWMKYAYFKRNGLTVKTRRATADALVVKEVFEWEEYDLAQLALPPVATIIDIGAHIGCFTLYAAGQISQGRVFACEPQSDNYRLLSENVRQNQLKNVDLFNIGIAGASGQRELFLSYNSGGHSLSFRHGDHSQAIQCVSLDDFIRQTKIEHCDLLKIDCEGGEFEILESAALDTLRKIDSIVGEWHDPSNDKANFNRLIGLLEGSGFKVTWRESGWKGFGMFRATREQIE